MAEEEQKEQDNKKAPKVIYWAIEVGSKGVFAPGQEEELTKVIDARQVAELKAIGAISGDWE